MTRTVSLFSRKSACLCIAPDDEKSNHIKENEIKTVFQNKQGRKTIDVYWISDDGGEIILNVTALYGVI